jgi:hypothetical protein
VSHDDFEAEPDPATPGHLPPGETILWQGAPDWRSLAWRVYHLREVTAYFGILGLWRGFSAWWDTSLPTEAVLASASLLVPAMLCGGILAAISRLSARTTTYTITSKRLVFRIGIALPATINLPFSSIGNASLDVRPSGSGDISVTLSGADKLAYLVLWPHARPWWLKKPEPALRCVPEATKIAGILARALREATMHHAAETPQNDNATAAGDSSMRGNMRSDSVQKTLHHDSRRDLTAASGSFGLSATR